MGFIFSTIWACALYSLACFGLGCCFYNVACHLSHNHCQTVSIPFLASMFLLGSGIFANIWLTLLSFSIFHKWIVIVFIIFGASYGILQLWTHYGVIKTDLNQIFVHFTDESTAWKAIICLTLLIIFQTAIVCFSPLEYNGDAAAFYMVLPKLLIETKTLSLLGGYESFMTIGLQGEFHFAALMILGADWGAKFFTWPIGLSCAVLLAAITQQTTGIGFRGKWLTIIFLFTSTAFILVIGDGKTDLFGAAIGCAAFYWLFLKSEISASFQFFIVGIFTGFAIIAKFSYLPLIIPSIGILTFWSHFSENLDETSFSKISIIAIQKKYIWMLIGILIPVFLHFIKNGILFSEPLAPFFYFEQNPYADWINNQSWFSAETIRKIILSYPLALIYGKYPFQNGNLSVLLLSFLPLIFLMSRSKHLFKSQLFQITSIGMIGVVIWVILRPGAFAPRYILYSLLLMIPLISVATEWVLKQERSPRILSSMVSVICVFYLIGFNGILIKKNVERFHDDSSRIALEKASATLNDMVKPNERVVSLNYFTYWLKPAILESISSTLEKDALRVIDNSEDAWKYMYSNGFRYVLVDSISHKDSIKLLNPDRSPERIKVTKIFDEQNFSVYKIRDVNQDT